MIDAGGTFLFNPFIFFDFSTNPFKAETRRFPVDLACGKEINSTVIFQLPTGYSVKSLPPSLKFTTPDGSASFVYISNASGNSLQFNVTLKISKSVFTETEYLELRQFFSEVVKHINTPIEFGKT